VAVHTRAPRPPLSLEAELEGALTDAVGGDPPGPQLAKRLERVARAILLRRGLGAARAVVQSDAHGTVVHVVLPPEGARVREIRVRVDSAV
jgi:hypothetical protein